MSPERMEGLGLTWIATGCLAAIFAVAFLVGWSWALLALGVMLVAAGFTLVRTAALTSPAREAGDSQ